MMKNKMPSRPCDGIKQQQDFLKTQNKDKI